MTLNQTKEGQLVDWMRMWKRSSNQCNHVPSPWFSASKRSLYLCTRVPGKSQCLLQRWELGIPFKLLFIKCQLSAVASD